MSGIRSTICDASAPLPKFVIHRSILRHELRKQRGTSTPMILVPLFDLKFLHELAATAVGTSNRRHYLALSLFPNRRNFTMAAMFDARYAEKAIGESCICQ